MRFLFFGIAIFTLVFVLACKKDKTIPVECTTFTFDTCQLTKTNINGISFENVSYQINASHVQPLKDINASWITTMPFGYVLGGDDSVQYNSDFQWIGEKRAGVIEIIDLCHTQDLKVMIKPHLWIIGSWIGDFELATEASWQTFEKSYLDYVIDFAQIADSTGCEAFCIGVEMRKVVTQRPNFWPVLIDSIRAVYSGPITYAANWDNYQNVTFWNSLDLIGIDAYFPVSDAETPTAAECYDGWETNFNDIKNLSESTGKHVIFTEYGYRNVDHTGQSPWDENSNSTNNLLGQQNAYQALYCRFWTEPWFEGGFLWKWHPNHNNAGGIDNNRFTPQNKPVEQLIQSVFQETN